MSRSEERGIGREHGPGQLGPERISPECPASGALVIEGFEKKKEERRKKKSMVDDIWIMKKAGKKRERPRFKKTEKGKGKEEEKGWCRVVGKTTNAPNPREGRKRMRPRRKKKAEGQKREAKRKVSSTGDSAPKKKGGCGGEKAAGGGK